MSTKIVRAKHIIKKQIKTGEYSSNALKYFKYYKIYPMPTENIKDIMNCIDFSSIDNALCVLSSGDQALNLAYEGVKNIDTFDWNGLTEHNFGLKLAMIEKFRREVYIEKMQKLYSDDTSIEELSAILSGLLPYMDQESRNYWKSLIDYNFKLQKDSYYSLNLMKMLSYNYPNHFEKVNAYLASDAAYNALKENLKHTNISFKRANGFKLAKKFDGPYDLMYMSDILNNLVTLGYYEWGKNAFNTYIDELKKLLSDNGTIVNIASHHNTEKPLWDECKLRKGQLFTEEVHEVKGAFPEYNETELVILSRKKGVTPNEV